MLVKPPLEKVLPKVDNRYTLAILVAKRARQLVTGAQPMVDSESPNLVTVACEELAANQIVGIKGQHTPVVPLRPEIEAARLAAKNAAAQASLADAVREALDQTADYDDDFDESDVEIISENLLTVDAGYSETEANEGEGAEDDPEPAESNDSDSPDTEEEEV